MFLSQKAINCLAEEIDNVIIEDNLKLLAGSHIPVYFQLYPFIQGFYSF